MVIHKALKLSEGMSLSPSTCTSRSTYLESNPESYFAFTKTPNYSEVCHHYRLCCIYPVNAHLPAIGSPSFTSQQAAMMIFKGKALMQAMGNILEENWGVLSLWKHLTDVSFFKYILAQCLHLSEFYTSGNVNKWLLLQITTTAASEKTDWLWRLLERYRAVYAWAANLMMCWITFIGL